MALDRNPFLKFSGGRGVHVRTVTAADAAELSDRVIVCNATSAAFTLTLPPIARAYDASHGGMGQVLYVMKSDASANAITIDGNAAETINGAANMQLTTQFDATVLVATATGWLAFSEASASIGANSVGNAALQDDAVDSAEIADGAVDPVHLASGYRSVASDGALALAATDRTVLLAATTTGAKAATMTATHAGHVIDFRLVTASGGSYTLAVTGGNVTLDAANEGARIVYSGSAWTLVALTGGATLV